MADADYLSEGLAEDETRGARHAPASALWAAMEAGAALARREREQPADQLLAAIAGPCRHRCRQGRNCGGCGCEGCGYGSPTPMDACGNCGIPRSEHSSRDLAFCDEQGLGPSGAPAASEFLAVGIDAGGDYMGNPRRGWLVYDQAGELQGFVEDSSQSPPQPLQTAFPGARELCKVRVLAREWRQARYEQDARDNARTAGQS